MSLDGRPTINSFSSPLTNTASRTDSADSGRTSGDPCGKVNFPGGASNVRPYEQQSPHTQIPRGTGQGFSPAKPIVHGNADIPNGSEDDYRHVTSDGACRVLVRSGQGHLTCNGNRSAPKDTLVEGALSSDRHEGDGRFEPIKQYSLMMGLVNELRCEKNSPDSESVARQDHPIVKELKRCFDNSEFNQGCMYEASFTVNDSGTKIQLVFCPTLPVTLDTPRLEAVNVFDKAFNIEKKSPESSPDPIRIEIDRLNNEALFSGIIHHIRSLKQARGDDPGLKLYARFRAGLPLDQEISTVTSYRLITGGGAEAQVYVSDSLRISGESEEPLYIEFQMPVIKLIDSNLDEIIDITKEYPSTIKKFHINTDHPKSINNRENRKLIQSESIPIVRNMEQTSPEKNAFTGEFLGSGIAQKVSVHGGYPSMALKFLPRPMDKVEARIVINTLDITQTLTQRIMQGAVSGGNDTPKICFSPVEYLAVVDQDNKEDEEGNKSSDELSNSTGKFEVHNLRLPRRPNSHSESEAFHDMVKIPIDPLSLDRESKESVDNGKSSGVDIRLQKLECAVQSAHDVNKNGSVVWVAGMQRKYDKKQMVEYILQNPNEDPSIKTEITKGIFKAIDVFDGFNKEMEIEGVGSLIKCIIDSNFANFAFDRDGDEHRLIYLDVAPATLSLNGQVVPGNQFMMNWFPSRQDFVYKLSTDAQMSKLFVLVMVTNQFRKLETMKDLYEKEGVCNSVHETRAHSLAEVVNNISNELSDNERFMTWCDSHFFTFVSGEVKVEMFNGDAREMFFHNAVSCFKEYMSEEVLSDRKPLTSSRHLNLSDKIGLLRVLADVVANHMSGIKKDAVKTSPKSVKKTGLISKGVIKDIVLSDNELKKLMDGMIDSEFCHSLSALDSKKDVFYEVVSEWLKKMCDRGDRQGLGNKWEPQNSDELREAIVTSVMGAGGNDSESEKKTLTIPAFQKALSEKLQGKTNVLLIEPFSGDDKQVRTVLYEWGVASDGKDVINMKEYSGAETLNKLISSAKPETLILVNHHINQIYSMGDVHEHHWSSVCLLEKKPEQSKQINFVLPVVYDQEQSDYEKLTFETIIMGLKELYMKRAEASESGQGGSSLSKEGFLEKVIGRIPQNCAEWKQSLGSDNEHAVIKMKLSSCRMLRYKPFLRGYADMVRQNFGSEHCSTRIYMIMCFPEAGRYVRWMLRVATSKDNQELSYMNFRGPFSLEELKSDIRESTPESSSKVDFMFIDGGYGYSSGNFYLYAAPKSIVRSGYSEDFFDDIESVHPEGKAGEDTGSEGFCDDNSPNEHSDNLSSLEIRERIF